MVYPPDGDEFTISPTPLASQSTTVFLNNTGPSCIKQSMMPSDSLENMVIERFYECVISRMLFTSFQSVLLITGYSFLNGMESYMWISSFHLDYALHLSFSTSSARDYIGLWTGYSVEILFIIWMISYWSMIQILSSLVPLPHILVSPRTARKGKMDGLSTSQALNSILISCRHAYQWTSIIEQWKVYKGYSYLALSHTAHTKTSLDSSHS